MTVYENTLYWIIHCVWFCFLKKKITSITWLHFSSKSSASGRIFAFSVATYINFTPCLSYSCASKHYISFLMALLLQLRHCLLWQLLWTWATAWKTWLSCFRIALVLLICSPQCPLWDYNLLGLNSPWSLQSCGNRKSTHLMLLLNCIWG